MYTLTMPRDARPVCADPEYLAVVDRAFEQYGGPESHWMRENLCPGCSVRLECLLAGNATGEHGVWGGLTTNERVRAGGRSPRSLGGRPRNLVGLDHGRDHRTDRPRQTA